MKKDITHFGISIIITAILLMAVDFVVGSVADKMVDKMPNYSGQIAKDNYRLHRLETDIVILGSSRGSHHYVTALLGDSIDNYMGKQYSIYNAAIDGKFANSNLCAAEMIISRYRPKLVIIDLSESQLASADVADIKFSSPFYRKDSIVCKYIDNISFEEKMLTKSSLYRYNRKLVRIASSFLRQTDVDDGYLPLYGTTIDTTKYNKSAKEENAETQTLNSYSETNFRNVLRKYTAENIPLIIACSPIFRPNKNNNQLRKLCNEYNVPFIELYDLPYFNEHPGLFKDAKHLNNDGAHIYTKIFFEELKPYLDNIRPTHNQQVRRTKTRA